MGLCGDIPTIDSRNLFQFTSAHKAPMWRRDLHEEVGTFDTSPKSVDDWQFWLHCLARGKSFQRIKTPHVVYYHKAEGLSTCVAALGLEEQRWVAMRYRRQLIKTL